MTGAVLLVVAEFTTLFSVHFSSYRAAVRTVSAGSHDGFALAPVALFAVALAALLARDSVRRTAALGLIAAGVIALGVALVADLPDTRAHGLTDALAIAQSTPGPAIYLETLGAVVLLLAGGFGLTGRPAGRRGAPGRRPAATAPSEL